MYIWLVVTTVCPSLLHDDSVSHCRNHRQNVLFLHCTCVCVCVCVWEPGVGVATYDWAGSGIRSLSKNSRRRKSWTSSTFSGPPRLSMIIPVLGLYSSIKQEYYNTYNTNLTAIYNSCISTHLVTVLWCSLADVVMWRGTDITCLSGFALDNHLVLVAQRIMAEQKHKYSILY